MKNIVLITILLCSFHSYAQVWKNPKFSFGIQILLQGEAQSPVISIADSVVIENDNGGLGSPMLSLFAEKQVTKAILIRAELNYVEVNTSNYLVYDLKPTIFGYYQKGKTLLNPTIQVPVMANLRLPSFPYLSILGGLDAHFQFERFREPDYPYNWDRSYPRRATDVLNALNRTSKSFVPFWILGFKIDVWRLAFIARHEQNMGGSYTKDLQIGDNSYRFYTRRAYTYFGLSYKFYSLKSKKKQKENPAPVISR
jgi:hypothetical protein